MHGARANDVPARRVYDRPGSTIDTVPTDAPAPRPLRAGGVLVALQGLAGAVFAVTLAVSGLAGHQHGGNVFGEAGYFAVLSVGGFLGLGSTRVAVPWRAFQIVKASGKVKCMLDATREHLEKAPRVEGRNYERLYPAATAEPIFVYWDVEWVAEPETALR